MTHFFAAVFRKSIVKRAEQAQAGCGTLTPLQWNRGRAGGFGGLAERRDPS